MTERAERKSYFIHTILMFAFASSKIRLGYCCCSGPVPDGRLATERRQASGCFMWGWTELTQVCLLLISLRLVFLQEPV